MLTPCTHMLFFRPTVPSLYFLHFEKRGSQPRQIKRQRKGHCGWRSQDKKRDESGRCGCRGPMFMYMCRVHTHRGVRLNLPSLVHHILCVCLSVKQGVVAADSVCSKPCWRISGFKEMPGTNVWAKRLKLSLSRHSKCLNISKWWPPRVWAFHYKQSPQRAQGARIIAPNVRPQGVVARSRY